MMKQTEQSIMQHTTCSALEHREFEAPRLCVHRRASDAAVAHAAAGAGVPAGRETHVLVRLRVHRY